MANNNGIDISLEAGLNLSASEEQIISDIEKLQKD